MRRIYNVWLYIIMPLILIRLFWKSRHMPGYAQRLKERFGFCPKPSQTGGLWVHAVSVGEVVAVVPFIRRLLKQAPTLPIYITTMTPTGADRVTALFEDSVEHYYVPYDLSGAINRFLNRVMPKAVIIMETELWPNFLYHCHRRHIPILLANARLSAKSAAGYRRLGRFTQGMLQHISIIAAQSQADARRFIDIGAKAEQVQVTGSVKFDIQIPASTHEKAAVFRNLWGNDRPVWVAASTHEGEDDIILRAFTTIKRAFADVLLVLVPRHPERFGKVAALCKRYGYQVVMRSENKACDKATDIFIGDSMGELNAFYVASDVAFVGGSFVPVGGHNLLEPASLGIPAVTGPHVFNFAEITRLLQDAGAVKKVFKPEELTQVILQWLQDVALRAQVGEKGRQVVAANRGAVEAHMKILTTLLDGGIDKYNISENYP